MTRPTSQTFAVLGSLLVATPAWATEYYVGPDGSGDECVRSAPCNIGTGAELAVAGDTVVLLDGVYHQGVSPVNSGTADAWITFQADKCALPIIEGEGEDAVPDEQGNYPTGVYTGTSTYIRYVGIVSRYWDSGFANGWTGEGTTNSNGNIEYINCIGDGNHRTAFAMYSAGNFVVRECLAAHSGGSPTHSWSSGVQLYAVQGGPNVNIIERNVSFENVDAQKNNDGSGFIVDEDTTGATIQNNIAFGNGGSCMRLTRSGNTRMLHFSCYHNGQNPTPNSPTDPGEFYFTDQISRDTATVQNTLAAAAGTGADPAVFLHPPTSGLANNVTVDSGPATFFSDPEGMHPDFRPPASVAATVENTGTTMAGSEVDIGFDPKCIIKQVPEVPYSKSWWSYSINYDYIKSLGGVAACFHPKPRTGGPDVGAYEMSGPPHEFTTPGSCVPIVDPGTGGAASGGGASAAGGTDGSGAGPSSGGSAEVNVGGGSSAVGGAAAGGSSALGVGGAAANGASGGTGGTSGGGSSCSISVHLGTRGRTGITGLWLFMFSVWSLQRRRRSSELGPLIRAAEREGTR